MLHYDNGGGEKVPDKLNFWVTVDLTYTLDGIRQSGTIKNVTLGQGTSNDWWITSPNCMWLDRKYQCRALSSGSFEILVFWPNNNLLGMPNNNKVRVAKAP